ncbi:hypothetical protein [Pseudonocardia sp. H11422]|uniref:hypothetical protein n=1 Tax=Pseudonocardia sp. H11422 TaxID=2835866 RepID=UPI00292D3CC8|nr:hypothetical protein [Pseudonocardia sp. H11422]
MSARSLVSDGGAPSPEPAAGRSGGRAGGSLSRRRLLGLALLAPAGAALGGTALSACSTTAAGDAGPDPLIALVDQARADAALAAAAIAARPALAARVEPLRAARAEHAAALDAEVTRLDPARTSTAPAAPPAPAVRPTLTAIRDALAASTRGAEGLIGTLPVERVGLVASVAACCATYAAVLE